MNARPVACTIIENNDDNGGFGALFSVFLCPAAASRRQDNAHAKVFVETFPEVCGDCLPSFEVIVVVVAA
jgi:hypothetical protein